MSRSGYDEGDCENQWGFICYRGAVTSALRGKRGQALLAELAEAMDAMPTKELIADDLVSDGSYCALGVVGAKRGIDMSKIDPEEPQHVANAFDIAESLAREIEFVNDECGNNHKYVDGRYTYSPETPAERWVRVRKWVTENIKLEPKT